MQHTLLAAGESVHYFAQTFQADTLSVANNTWLTALVGTLPLVAFFIFLMTLKWKAHTSAIGAVIVSLALAIFVFGMPVSYSLASVCSPWSSSFGWLCGSMTLRSRPTDSRICA